MAPKVPCSLYHCLVIAGCWDSLWPGWTKKGRWQESGGAILRRTMYSMQSVRVSWAWVLTVQNSNLYNNAPALAFCHFHYYSPVSLSVGPSIITFRINCMSSPSPCELLGKSRLTPVLTDMCTSLSAHSKHPIWTSHLSFSQRHEPIALSFIAISAFYCHTLVLLLGRITDCSLVTPGTAYNHYSKGEKWIAKLKPSPQSDTQKTKAGEDTSGNLGKLDA